MKRSELGIVGERLGDDCETDKFDVFLSYARLDDVTGQVTELVAGLQAQGLRVFVDDQEIETFESIPDRIRQAMACSRLFLAFYSNAYPTRRACQWELTAAIVAEQQLGDGAPRVLAINPETSWDHIHPVQLRERSLPHAPVNPDAVTALCARVAQLAAAVSGTLGAADESLPHVFGYRLINSPAFIGRLPQLWAVHSALQSSDAAELMDTSDGGGVAQLVGIGGVGKSLLAEEYALRFAAAYPGGVFWLRASAAGDGSPLQGDRDGQMRHIARALGASIDGPDLEDVIAELRNRLALRATCLWVVDDLPPGLSAAEVRNWLAPHQQTRTLITTRSTGYRALATTVELGGFSADEGYAMLSRRRPPDGELEQAAARGLVDDLAGHALAIAITAAALETYGDLRSFADYRRALGVLTHDELELAAELAEELPNGHDRSVAATLARSIDLLEAEGIDLLLLASMLAPAPIPDDAIAVAFAGALGSDAVPAIHRAIRAMSQVQRLCLCESTPDGRLVHSLVSRTIRHRTKRDAVVHPAFRQGATAAIAIELRHLVSRPPSAVMSALLEHGHRLLADAISEDAVTLELVHGMAHCELARGRYAAARKLHTQLLEGYARRLGEEHPNTIATTANLADVLFKLGDYEPAEVLAERAVQLSERVLGSEHPITLTSMTSLALIRQERGEFAASRGMLERLVETRQRQFGEDHSETAAAMCNLALTLHVQGELDAACRLQRQGLDILRRTLGNDDPSTLLAEHNLAGMLADQGDLNAARVVQERLLAARRRMLGASHPSTLASMNNLATTLRRLGEFEAARALQQQVLETATRELGETHPHTLWSMDNLATTIRSQGNLTEARDLHERVLAASQSLWGDEHPGTLTALSNLGETLHAQGDLAAAQEVEEHALAARRRVLGDGHPETLMSMSNLSATLYRRGNLADAHALQAEALEARQRLLGDDHPDTLVSMANLGAILNSQGDHDAAHAMETRALDLAISVLGASHPHTLVLTRNLATTLRAQGDPAAAQALEDKAHAQEASKRPT